MPLPMAAIFSTKDAQADRASIINNDINSLNRNIRKQITREVFLQSWTGYMNTWDKLYKAMQARTFAWSADSENLGKYEESNIKWWQAFKSEGGKMEGPSPSNPDEAKIFGIPITSLVKYGMYIGGGWLVINLLRTTSDVSREARSWTGRKIMPKADPRSSHH